MIQQHEWQGTGISTGACDWLETCKHCGATLYTEADQDGSWSERYTPPEDGPECDGHNITGPRSD